MKSNRISQKERKKERKKEAKKERKKEYILSIYNVIERRMRK